MFSPSSPFVRKVLACAIARDLDGRIELITVNANASPAELLDVAPLSKVPALVTDDGVTLYDSPVICEYLDSLGYAVALFPPSGGARWRALRFQALADGIMDAGVLRRGETMRRATLRGTPSFNGRRRRWRARSTNWNATYRIGRSILAPSRLSAPLGYLDFRYAHEPWRDAHPALASWLAAVETQACFTRTVAREPV